MLFGWDYQTRIFKVLMGKSPRKKSFEYLIEALSQKRLSKLLELKTDGQDGIFHLIALNRSNLDVLSILIEKIPQKSLFKLLQEEKEGVNGHTPFHIAASCNLEMILLLIKKMSANQLYALLTMGFPGHITPLNYIISQYQSGIKTSENVIDALVDRLSTGQLFKLICVQLQFIASDNKGMNNAVLIAKFNPKDKQDNDRLLFRENELKKQMLKQLCTHMQQGEGYSFPHTELYDENNYLLRIFLVQIKNKELYQAAGIKDYDGFILSKGLLSTILKYNRLEFVSSYAISRSKSLELISMEKRYGYTFYQVESSSYSTVLISTKKLPEGVHRYSVQQFINDIKFFSNCSSKSIIKPKLNIAIILNCIIGSPLTFEEDRNILGNLQLLVSSNTYEIDRRVLLNLVMPLISSKKIYKEQIYVDGEWIGYRALVNIEEVSADANEIIKKGKKICAGNKELIKYKKRMYEYQEIACLGAETIELLIDKNLFLPYINILSNLYLQTIDLNNQQYCELQRGLAKKFIKSGNNFVTSRRNLISTFSQVLQKVFPNSGIDVQTMGLLLCYDKISSYIEIISGFSTRLDHLKGGIRLILNNKGKDIIASINEFIPLYNKLINLAIKRFGTKRVAALYRGNKEEGDFLTACAEALFYLSIKGPFKYIEDMLLADHVGRCMEEIVISINDYQNLLNRFLSSVDINQKTTQLFIDNDYHAHYFDMIIGLYHYLEGNSKAKAEAIGSLSQYGGDFLSAQDGFQSSCHEIIHQILGQIYKQSKGEQSINSELEGSFISNLLQKSTRTYQLNMIR